MIPLEKSVSKVFTYIYIPLSFPLLSSNMSPPLVPTSKCAPHGAAQRNLLVNRALYFLTSGDCEILFEIFVCSWSLDGLSVALLCNCLSYSLGDSYETNNNGPITCTFTNNNSQSVWLVYWLLFKFGGMQKRPIYWSRPCMHPGLYRIVILFTSVALIIACLPFATFSEQYL